MDNYSITLLFILILVLYLIFFGIIVYEETKLKEIKMKLTKTTKHELTFQVKEYIGREGGMDIDNFGPELNNLKEAVNMLEIARAKEPSADWIIECRVETIVE